MDKAELIKRIVAAKGFEEADRKWLEALDDGQLTKFSALCAAPADPVAGGGDPEKKPAAASEPAKTEPEKKPEPVAAAAEKPKPAEPEKPKSDDEVLAMLSPEGREMYAEMRERRDAEIAELRTELIAQSGGAFDEDFLKGKPRKELDRILAGLHAAKPKPDYTGQGLHAHDATTKKDQAKHAPMPGNAFGAGF